MLQMLSKQSLFTDHYVEDRGHNLWLLHAQKNRIASVFFLQVVMCISHTSYCNTDVFFFY